MSKNTKMLGAKAKPGRSNRTLIKPRPPKIDNIEPQYLPADAERVKALADLGVVDLPRGFNNAQADDLIHRKRMAAEAA